MQNISEVTRSHFFLDFKYTSGNRSIVDDSSNILALLFSQVVLQKLMDILENTVRIYEKIALQKFQVDNKKRKHACIK